MLRALALSAITAVTAFSSMAFASAAVPNCSCANAEPGKVSAVAAAALMMSLRNLNIRLVYTVVWWRAGKAGTLPPPFAKKIVVMGVLSVCVSA